jgi:membrane protein DedA with SNARE-associated domain
MLVIAVGTAGSIVGSLPWYWAGRTLGLERLKRWAANGGRWLTLSAEEIERGDAWFKRWGAAAVCVGRCLPGVRGVISLPAGTARMPFPSFLLWSSLGALAWTTLLTMAGYALQARYLSVEHWLNPVTDVAVGLAVVAYVVRVVRHKPAA